MLASAAERFAAEGVDAVSVDAVAAAAGRTSGAVYAQFGSKQGLLLALLDEWKQSLATVVLAELELAESIEDRLRSVAANVIVSPTEETRRLLLLEQELWLRAARDPRVGEALKARSCDAQRFMARGFASWCAAGLLRSDVAAEILATRFRAMVHGLQVQQQLDGATMTVEDAASALAGALGVTFEKSDQPI